jgi:cysteinyl-tRNA synthetase
MTDYFGYNIKLIQNITDIDDKIIRKALEQNVDFREVSMKYETMFFDDCRRLNV